MISKIKCLYCGHTDYKFPEKVLVVSGSAELVDVCPNCDRELFTPEDFIIITETPIVGEGDE